MENVNIKSAISEEHVTVSKEEFNLNDVLNGTVVLPFEDELCVLIEAVENIRKIHEDCKEEIEVNPENELKVYYIYQTWHIILNKVYNKAINLLKNEIGKTQDENKKIEYHSILKNYIEKLERSEKLLNDNIKQHADIMWFGIN
jgi:hypothetical protein